MKRFENNKESSSCPETITGCGPDAGFAPISLNITTTTGGNFSVLVDLQNSVENLKKIVAKKLKVAKDRICLLHRERELQDGNLRENGLVDGSKIILIPNVETGLLAQRPENTVMQALESLNDVQVNDFLSGKTPLNLSMRLGDHMMLIQLQLSTVSPSSPSHNRSRPRSRSGRSSTSSSSSSSSSNAASLDSGFNNDSRNLQSATSNKKTIPLEQHASVNQDVSTSPSVSHRQETATSSSSSLSSLPDGELNSFLSRHGFDSIDDIVKNFSFSEPQSLNDEISSSKSFCEAKTTPINSCCSSSLTNSYNNVSTMIDQSPIKSLSNLVSNPLKSAPIKNIQTKCDDSNTTFIGNLNNASHIERASMCSDPISAKLTSCLCKRLDGSNTMNTASTARECETSQCQLKHEVLSTDVPAGSVMHNSEHQLITNSSTANALNAPKPLNIHSSSASSSSSLLLHKTVNNPIGKSKHRLHSSLCNVFKKNFPTISKDSSNCGNNEVNLDESTRSTITATNARALAEASRNLTQTLRKLSKEVFTNKSGLSDQASRKNNSGAVIESMKNHGKGIYSGTFSGTLNPALQDQYGRPKRDISTVIHILNDLLSATPQCNRDTRINYDPSISMVSRRGSIKQSIKHNFPTSEQECNKCVNNSSKSTNIACAYGECNGHSSSSVASSLFTAPNATSVTDSHHYNNSFNTCQETLSTLDASISNNVSSSDLNLSLSDERNLCTCNNSCRNIRELNDSNTTAIDITRMCSKCSIDLENSKTKCKLDQLRLVMQQKKQKREARKLKGTPYGARMINTQHNNNPNCAGGVSGTAAGNILGQAGNGNVGNGTATSAAPNTITSITPPSEVSPNHIVEEVDTAA